MRGGGDLPGTGDGRPGSGPDDTLRPRVHPSRENAPPLASVTVIVTPFPPHRRNTHVCVRADDGARCSAP
jgi:hypothetical protein